MKANRTFSVLFPSRSIDILPATVLLSSAAASDASRHARWRWPRSWRPLFHWKFTALALSRVLFCNERCVGMTILFTFSITISQQLFSFGRTLTSILKYPNQICFDSTRRLTADFNVVGGGTLFWFRNLACFDCVAVFIRRFNVSLKTTTETIFKGVAVFH